MVKIVLEKFQVEYLQVLDENGNVDKKLEPKISGKDLKKMYALMVLTRTLDRIALKMQREGRIGTYAESLGEEATQIGSAFALKKQDWIFPSYREHGAYVTRGLPLKHWFRLWQGSEDGHKLPKKANYFTISIPVGTQTLHAVGASIAAQIMKKKHATLVYFGDGGTSEGDCHEAFNFAGVFNTPTVFICRNNQWAISVPRKRQCAAKTLAQKAAGYGFKGIQVDGNDVLAVYKATKEAADKARKGKGATLIECYTYRMGAHTTADDPGRYRKEKELKEWQKKDPVKRFQKYLNNKNLWNKSYEEKLLDDCEKKVSTAIKKMEKMQKAKSEDMFKYLYSEMNPDLKEQLKETERYSE